MEIFLFLPGLVVLPLAVANFAQSRGYHFWKWFWFTFFVPVIPLIILWFLKDKNIENKGVEIPEYKIPEDQTVLYRKAD